MLLILFITAQWSPAARLDKSRSTSRSMPDPKYDPEIGERIAINTSRNCGGENA